MKLKLKPGTQFAPSGLKFTDPTTGATFDGYERSIQGAVDLMIEHRRRNPKYFDQSNTALFDRASVSQEYYRQLYQRRPEMFVINPETAPEPDPNRCLECGSSDIEETLCPTCSGRRVTARKCRQCGAKLPL